MIDRDAGLKKMFTHSSREKHGFRRWWHFGDRSCFSIELSWWTHFCHTYIETNDNVWTLSLALPPIAIWFKFDGFNLWHPQRKCIATWENNREFWIPESRECKVSIHDWRLRFVPWGKTMEWAKADPWWVRGVSLDVKELALGPTRYEAVQLRTAPLMIPMPEGLYAAQATIERCTWKRPRWFPSMRTYVRVDVPKGIPFAGKGENSYDCDDDGLFGYSVEGESLEKAIAHGIESVLKSRRRYGMPTADTIAKSVSVAR
jgi:hypothetical protein